MKSIFSIDDVKDDELSRLFFRARTFANNFSAAQKHLRGAVMMTAFFEPSTRTRMSFEMAALRLGMQATNFAASSSSMHKGESVAETLRNLLALAPDILIVRHSEELELLGIKSDRVSIINAGDGINEHPSQALLDSFTLLEHFKSDDLVGKRILIIGDLAHSRVAHSNIKLLRRLGADLTLLSPDIFKLIAAPAHTRSITNFDDHDGNYDAVMCLRIQKERMALGCGIDDDEYYRRYGLNEARLVALGKSCALMHPGPINFGVEITKACAYGSSSLIEHQVKNGVLIRAALMEHILIAGGYGA